MAQLSAVIVGSGPNGLAAAITLAQAGFRITVFEAEATIGGGARSGELTLPGFTHDLCSAIHPLAVASPFFRSLPLDQHGLQWIEPPSQLAHPLDDGSAILLDRSLETTATQFGSGAAQYRDLFAPLMAQLPQLLDTLLAPMLPPKHPLQMARFGLKALQSARGLAERQFHDARARALFAGCAAHAFLPLEAPGSASFGLILNLLGHSAGWPLPRGGAQAITSALASYLRGLGGEIIADHPIRTVSQLPPADVVMFDVAPKNLLAITGDRLSLSYHRRLAGFRYGPAAFKIDWALNAPIPWRATACAQAATVHLGGSLDQIAHAERVVAEGGHAEQPFVLLTQPSLFDSTRAPAGKHTAWAYCHVPNGSSYDMTSRIEEMVNRFAPGFREHILVRRVTTPADLELHNANYIGGDIVGGANDLWQLFARPILSSNPYATPVKGWYLCSASTPPGGGVHGMSGYHAARAAIRAMGTDR